MTAQPLPDAPDREAGKAGGPDYVRQFALTRVVTEKTVRRGFAPEWEPGAEG